MVPYTTRLTFQIFQNFAVKISVYKMVESEMQLSFEYDKQIEDVINARKKAGQYDVCLQSNTIACRHTFSAPSAGISGNKSVYLDDTVWMSDGDLNNYPFNKETFNIGPTDSEITVVRVKREGLQFKLTMSQNNWDLHDEAIPGDGTHLGESPSLVNLVTLVGQSTTSTSERNEYLVPLSSWDPCDKPQEFLGIQSAVEADCPTFYDVEASRSQNLAPTLENASSLTINEFNKCSEGPEKVNTELQIIKAPDEVATNVTTRSTNLAGRILKFLRKYHLKKPTAITTAHSRVAKSEVRSTKTQI